MMIPKISLALEQFVTLLVSTAFCVMLFAAGASCWLFTGSTFGASLAVTGAVLPVLRFCRHLMVKISIWFYVRKRDFLFARQWDSLDSRQRVFVGALFKSDKDIDISMLMGRWLDELLEKQLIQNAYYRHQVRISDFSRKNSRKMKVTDAEMKAIDMHVGLWQSR